MKKRITFFIGSMYGGGAERVISILANHFCQKDWNVDIVLLLENKVGYQLDRRIRIIDFTHSSGTYIKHLPNWIAEIRRYVKKNKPDRIVSFVGRINILVLTACLGLKVPIIVSERNDPKHDGRGPLMLKYCNLIYKRAKAVVYQTRYEKSCFSSKLHNGVIIGNPVTISVVPEQKKNYHEIVTAGRLQPQKNQEMLLKAIHILLSKYSDISVKIYGDGSLKEHLEKQIQTLKIGNNVSLCGHVTDLHDRIKSAGIFVLCSDYEGLSNALIEAMMLGLVCITTDYPGADELIENEKNGLIVPRNDYRRLAQAINRVLYDEELSNILSFNAIESSKMYLEHHVLKKWEDVIE